MKQNTDLFAFAIAIVFSLFFSQGQADVTNPFLPHPDPFVTRSQDGKTYYLLCSMGSNITIYDGSSLSTITSHSTTVFTPTDDMKELWSPTLWYMKGNWWIYFTATYPHASHRIYVLKSTSDDALGPYLFQGEFPTAPPSIDPSILTIHGTDYLMYVRAAHGCNSVWITALADPMTPTGPNTQLIYPDRSWEKGGKTSDNYPVSEGPTALYHEDKTFIVYSGSDTATPVYCLGLLTYINVGDPTDIHKWIKKGPVFSASPENGVYGPGRGTFTKSSDGTQDWIIYHAKNTKAQDTHGRSLRMQPFTWYEDGTPNFGTPVPEGPMTGGD